MKKILFFLSILFFSIARAEDVDLSPYEKSLYSEHGEDGIIARIFELIQPKRRYCVEIGANDGITRSNTYLLRLQGWNCSLFDRTNEKLAFKLYKEFLTAENLNDIFNKYNVPSQIDFLSINHYNDFYLWKALDSNYRPSVVLLKYNASHAPTEDKIAKYRPYFCGDETNYFGASLFALYNLGKSKGYSLVYIESVGMNVFFIRDDILKEKGLYFKNMNEVEKIYRPPIYKSTGGYRQDPKGREYLTSADVL